MKINRILKIKYEREYKFNLCCILIGHQYKNNWKESPFDEFIETICSRCGKVVYGQFSTNIFDAENSENLGTSELQIVNNDHVLETLRFFYDND